MSRGISTIIAAILLLVITIGLAGTAYLFITGFFTSQTSKIIGLLNVDCTNKNITIVISNQGTDRIEDGEINVLIDNQDQTSNFDLDPLDPYESEIDTWDPGAGAYTGSVHILVTSPSNSQSVTIWC